MSTPTDELDLLAATDPAADLRPDPGSETARQIRHRIVTRDGVTPTMATRPRRRLPSAAAAVVSVAAVTTGAAAVAQMGPFASEWEACHEAPSAAGREVPYAECADFVSERVLAEVEADGSEFEREVLTDRVVTREEYDAAAHRTAACIQGALDEAGVEGSASAQPSSWQLGFRYDFQVTYPEGTGPLPWESESAAPEATGDDDTVRPATRLTDEMIQRDPMTRCQVEHYERIDRVWEAQQIAAQR